MAAARRGASTTMCTFSFRCLPLLSLLLIFMLLAPRSPLLPAVNLLTPVRAWTGMDEIRVLPDPKNFEDLRKLLPIDVGEFFHKYYDTDMLLLSQEQSGFDLDRFWQSNMLEEHYNKFREGDGMGHIKVHPGDNSQLGKRSLSDETFADFKRTWEMDNKEGDSFVLQYEYLSEDFRPMQHLEKALFKAVGIPCSLHLYVSSPGAKVLAPHTDPYDVMVIQLSGTKNWRACVPSQELAQSYGLTGNYSDSELCQLQEMKKGKLEGCTTYSVKESKTLNCIDFDFAPGSFLYMPKGVVHYANTTDKAIHVTVGLHRWNMQWLDVFRHIHQSADYSRTAQILEVYAESKDGLHMQEAVPGWLLECFGERFPCEESKKELHYEQLVDLFNLHMTMFASWLRGVDINTLADLDAIDQFWSRGYMGMGVMTTREHLYAAFEKVGAVKDYHASANRKRARKKKSLNVRDFGDPPRKGKETLCDKMEDWASECKGSNAKSCTVVVTTGKGSSCTEYCQSQGLVCETGYDDMNGECVKVPGEERQSCGFDMYTQTCVCALPPSGKIGPKVKIKRAQVAAREDKPGKPRRYFGEQKAYLEETLCDKMGGWAQECKGSDEHTCEVFIAPQPKKSCTAYCKEQGMYCENGWDDVGNSCTRSKRGKPSCDRAMWSHICRCTDFDPKFRKGFTEDVLGGF